MLVKSVLLCGRVSVNNYFIINVMNLLPTDNKAKDFANTYLFIKGTYLIND